MDAVIASSSAARAPCLPKGEELDPLHIALLVSAGTAAGLINTLAGGGSLLSVPLLVFLGLPGEVANGTNRIGILAQGMMAIRGFRQAGLPSIRLALPILPPVLIGAWIGAWAIAHIEGAQFERLFGVVMVILLIPTLRGSLPGRKDRPPARPWPRALQIGVFFAVGLYGGAIQAGAGLFLLMALQRSGFDLVVANSVKVVVIFSLTAAAVPIFIWADQVDWTAALALFVGFAIGGTVGAWAAVRGGERIIRPVMALAVLAMAGRMLHLY